MSFDRGLRDYFLVALGLFALRVVLGLVSAPPPVAMVLTLVVTVLFVGLPVLAFFRAASFPWSFKSSIAFVVAGAALHAGCAVLLGSVLPRVGLATVFVQALAQLGLMVWTLGLGAFLAQLIREKNLILPVALFLAGFDAFLIFNPASPTTALIQGRPEFFRSVAMDVPALKVATPEAETTARVEPIAFVGPADLFFIATFLVCLFKFKMRVKETARWLVPVLAVYLVVVLLPIGLGMLPALVPIGATVLLVNRREFQLTGEERAATIGVGLLALALAGFGIYRAATYRPPEPPIDSSQRPGVQAPPERAASPGQAVPGRSR
ncbi:MAG: hypothetical protein KIT11_07555 [Fimbriimonadaceae bacterium]|nr:hypothetical protein [Fimbriimonadaceae bacterium]QYK56208.1 MAG: hypothetical protein KF733_01745 [Fimbriimonadaceae bacterium]